MKGPAIAKLRCRVSVRLVQCAMSYHQFTLRLTEPMKDAVIRKLSELGSLGCIDEQERLIAYFPKDAPLAEIARELRIITNILEASAPGGAVSLAHDEIPYQDWNRIWKEGFTPIPVGARFVILPPWEQKRQGFINLVIDPGMAFGTGHHETTRSCLILLENQFPRAGCDRFLDLGTGTGVLAIAAYRLGYREVIGIDNDPLAIAAARMNLALNQAESIALYEGDISRAAGLYDVIAANLISGLLIELAPEISGRLKPSGIAVLSGILKGQDAEVVGAVEAAGLSLLEIFRDGKWVSLVCKRS